MTCEKAHARAEMEREWSKHDRASEQNRKQGDYVRVRRRRKILTDCTRKKRCIQGEFSGDSHDTSLTF